MFTEDIGGARIRETWSTQVSVSYFLKAIGERLKILCSPGNPVRRVSHSSPFSRSHKRIQRTGELPQVTTWIQSQCAD